MPLTRRALLVLLAVVLLVTGAGAARAAEPVTLTGTYELLARDLARPDPDIDHYVDILREGDRHHRLRLPAGLGLAGGTPVRVTGTRAGPREPIDVSDVDVLGAARKPNVAEDVTVLVILAYWTAPDSVTQQRAHDQILGDDARWFAQASYGQVTMTGRVTPWLRIPAPASGQCQANDDVLMANARSKARALGAAYDPDTYSRTVLYFPRCTGSDTSGVAGWAYEPGDRVWLNGYMDRRTSVHELGHSFGMSHARAYKCTSSSGARVTLGGSCAKVTYGDPYDAMGQSSYVAHFNGVNKSQAGWLDGDRRRVLTQATTSFTLGPYERSATTPNVVVVNSATIATRQYWLEYRQPVGYDLRLPAGATGGVLVHLRDSAVGPGGFLLDPTPSDASFATAVVKTGTTWTAPDGVRITVRSASSTGANVTVSGARQEPTPPSAPRYPVAKSEDRAVRLTWTPPVSAGTSPIFRYHVYARSDWHELAPSTDGPETAMTVQGLQDGQEYTFTIRAESAAGLGPGVTVTGSPLRLDPTVTISAPAANAVLRGYAPVTAAPVPHPQGSPVNYVVYSVDGVQAAQSFAAPWTANIRTANWRNGAHTLRATAYDTTGRSAEASVPVTFDNVPPSVSITAPVAGTTTEADTVQVEAAAEPGAGSAATIRRVTFYESADGWSREVATVTAAPWRATWNATHRNGTATFFAVAEDTEGVTATSAPVSVTVSHPLPVVTLTEPGETASGTSVTVRADAAARTPGRTVSRVDFYAGAQWLGADTTAPYAATWNTSGVSGLQYVRATAIEQGTGRTVETGRYVNVTNALPRVRVTSPARSSAPGVLTIGGTATPGDGSTATVSYVRVTTPGRTWQVAPAADGTFAVEWDATAVRGWVTITVEAFDSAGLRATTSHWVNVEVPPPTATMLTPGADAVLGVSTEVELSARAELSPYEPGRVTDICFQTTDNYYFAQHGCAAPGEDGVARFTWRPPLTQRGVRHVYPIVVVTSPHGTVTRHHVQQAQVRVLVATTPPAPEPVRATTGLDKSATVTWSLPYYYEPVPVTEYVVTRMPGGETRRVTEIAPVRFDRLQFGVEYTFTVAAVNAVGTGAAADDTLTPGGATALLTDPMAFSGTVTYGTALRVRALVEDLDGGGVVAGRTVELWACPEYAGSGGCAVGARAVTAADGWATLSYVPRERVRLKVRFPGSDPYLPSETWLGGVGVRAKVTAALSRTSAPAGTDVRLSGHVYPRHPGAKVYLQRYVDGRWLTGAYKYQSSTGYVSLPIDKPPGRYRYRLWAFGFAGVDQGWSPSVVLTVT